MSGRVSLLVAALLLFGCSSDDRHSRGERVYRLHCLVCHGEQGDGRGPSASAMWPPPRDFRLAHFKFAGVEDRGLPADEEIARVIRFGLGGSSMPAWELESEDVLAVIQYIKAFSLPGTGFRNPKLAVKRPVIPPDPYAGAQASDVARRGRRLYHSLFECAKCHPAYATAEEFLAWGSQRRTDAPEQPVPKWSAIDRAVLLPPDFLRHELRSVRVEGGRYRVDDLYRVIAYGLQGPMPGYGHLGTDDVWAVAYYVKSLSDASRAKP